MSLILVDPLDPSADKNRAVYARPRRRWELWRSPDDQPPWARPTLLVIAAAAALLYALNITQAGFAPFYSVAVKSMSVSWKAFFYGAFDPNATITIDKLAGAFWPQALSARIFGFSAWSLTLPQVVEGVISVLVMYRIVRRWAGAVPGLLAAGIFTLTPIVASMFGYSMEDGALIMCLVLAADAYQRAVMEARLRSLVWAGVWVGLGFQAKMLQAWTVLPALAIGYLLAAPVWAGRRLWHLYVAGIVMLVVSMSLIAVYTFTPAGDRPYVDGSTDNSAAAMVFGYNGLGRFGITVKGALPSQNTTSPVSLQLVKGGAAGGSVPAAPGGSVPAAPGGSVPAAPGGSVPAAPAPVSSGSPTPSVSLTAGWSKLWNSDYGPEIGWLYPLAVLALVFGLAWTRREPRTSQVRAGFVMWGVWLATLGLVLSAMSSIPHTAYMAVLAPPLAALSGVGIVMFWRAYRADGWRGWVLPATVAVELAWSLFLWRDYGGFLPWARDAMVVAGVVAIVVLVAVRLSHQRRFHLVTAGLAIGAAAMLAAPATWAASVVNTEYDGTAFNASAGPAGGSLGALPAGLPAGSAAGLATAAALAAGSLTIILGTDEPSLTAAERQVYDYVNDHRDGASYLMGTDLWNYAAPYILATGQEVISVGGYSGVEPAPTLTTVEDLVRSGQLRFFLEGEMGSLPGGLASAAIDSWVRSACTKVPAADFPAVTGTQSEWALYQCGQSA